MKLFVHDDNKKQDDNEQQVGLKLVKDSNSLVTLQLVDENGKILPSGMVLALAVRGGKLGLSRYMFPNGSLVNQNKEGSISENLLETVNLVDSYKVSSDSVGC